MDVGLDFVAARWGWIGGEGGGGSGTGFAGFGALKAGATAGVGGAETEISSAFAAVGTGGHFEDIFGCGVCDV